MIRLTAQQAHVLENANRVVPRPSASARPRYMLDGTECTAQITSLIIKRLIAKHVSGGFQRLVEKQPIVAERKERQRPTSNAIEIMRAALAAPPTVRAIGPGRR